ncbi:uncharacterized protein LOC135450645, partial [Zonotrichia leucophrys gambelii]|uniref:uncharacterized protein LOC135450645 n=1 Tax=Zonotrichia leucophrys gambelii TaxID=257770 RepID=UPI0031408476
MAVQLYKPGTTGGGSSRFISCLWLFVKMSSRIPLLFVLAFSPSRVENALNCKKRALRCLLEWMMKNSKELMKADSELDVQRHLRLTTQRTEEWRRQAVSPWEEGELGLQHAALPAFPEPLSPCPGPEPPPGHLRDRSRPPPALFGRGRRAETRTWCSVECAVYPGFNTHIPFPALASKGHRFARAAAASLQLIAAGLAAAREAPGNAELPQLHCAVTRGAEASPRVSLLTLSRGAPVSDPPFPGGLWAACALRARTTLLCKHCWVRALLRAASTQTLGFISWRTHTALENCRFREFISVYFIWHIKVFKTKKGELETTEASQLALARHERPPLPAPLLQPNPATFRPGAFRATGPGPCSSTKPTPRTEKEKGDLRSGPFGDIAGELTSSLAEAAGRAQGSPPGAGPRGVCAASARTRAATRERRRRPRPPRSLRFGANLQFQRSPPP